MSVKIMSMVFDAQGITSTQKLVMLAMADHAADDGTSIYPSVETICSKTGLSQAAVRKTLKQLRDDEKLIRITRKYTSRMPNKYAINLQVLSTLKRVLPSDTQESGLSPRSTQTITKKHPRLSPRSTESSLTINESSGEKEITEVLQSSVKAVKTRDIQTAFQACVNYPVDWVKGEGHAAKWLAENGYTPDEVQGCYRALKSQDYWKNIPLSLSSVKKQIGEWKNRQASGKVITIS